MIFLNNIPICQLIRVSYNDTCLELREKGGRSGGAGQVQFNSAPPTADGAEFPREK